MTKLASSLPGGEANGLGALATDTGDITPTARIRRIEAIRGDRDLVAKVMRRAMEERTGKTVLPFDLEEDMRSAFGEDNTE